MSQAIFLAALVATLAFLFFLLGEVVVKAYERYKRHYNALVRLEILLNNTLQYASDNVRNIATMRIVVSKGHAIVHLPVRAPLDPTIQSDLYDVRLATTTRGHSST